MPLSAAYFTVSLPTPPKEFVVILDDETDMLRVIPGQAIHLAHDACVTRPLDYLPSPPAQICRMYINHESVLRRIALSCSSLSSVSNS